MFLIDYSSIFYPSLSMITVNIRLQRFMVFNFFNTKIKKKNKCQILYVEGIVVINLIGQQERGIGAFGFQDQDVMWGQGRKSITLCFRFDQILLLGPSQQGSYDIIIHITRQKPYEINRHIQLISHHQQLQLKRSLLSSLPCMNFKSVQCIG